MMSPSVSIASVSSSKVPSTIHLVPTEANTAAELMATLTSDTLPEVRLSFSVLSSERFTAQDIHIYK